MIRSVHVITSIKNFYDYFSSKHPTINVTSTGFTTKSGITESDVPSFPDILHEPLHIQGNIPEALLGPMTSQFPPAGNQSL